MDETYRMLGRHHEADLEQEATRRRLATQLPPSERHRKQSGLTAPAHALRRVLLELRGAAAPPAPNLRRK